MNSPKGLIALAAIVIGVLPAATSCTSQQSPGSPARGGTSATGVPGPSESPVPAGSAPGTLQPPSKLAPYPVDSGTSVLVGSATSQATYDAQVTVTVSPQSDAVSSLISGTATELEVARVEIRVQSGTFVFKQGDFMYLGADGNVYPPIAAAGGVDNELGSGTIKAGGLAQGDLDFRVPVGGGFVQLYSPHGARVAWRATT